MAYEHKPGTGTVFKNDAFDPNGSEDNTETNYWGNMTINVEGKLWKARLYPKMPKDPSGKPYMRVSRMNQKTRIINSHIVVGISNLLGHHHLVAISIRSNWLS